MNVIELIPEVVMSNQHKGLREICEDKRIELDDLEPGQFVVFLNKRCDKMKCWAHNGSISYLRTTGKPFDKKDIVEFAKAFGASAKLTMPDTQAKSFDKAVAKRDKSHETDSLVRKKTTISVEQRGTRP